MVAGDYAPEHIPFLYYDGIRNDAARCMEHIVDYSSFAADLASGPSTFTFIAPNLVDDMHDPVIANDTNLANRSPITSLPSERHRVRALCAPRKGTAVPTRESAGRQSARWTAPPRARGSHVRDA